MRRISASGHFDPPMMTRSRLGTSSPVASRWSSRPIHTVCTPPAMVTFSLLISEARLAPSSSRPGSTRLAPTAGAEKGRPQALAWNIGMATRIVSFADRQ
ncbi:hypothetical protein D3C87_1797760 [compost metagenome]